MASKCALDFIDAVCQFTDENEEEDSSDGKTMVGKPPYLKTIEPATSSKYMDSDSEYQPSSEAVSEADSEEIVEPPTDPQENSATETREEGGNLPEKIRRR